ncbi:hypothetical protein CSC94_12470 [Zhengella mangrovi]|uniref:DUF7282 domain-containing protein n=1 Tax=Zhengella mangrovi TaxID=1982044 RepID=A0A2G1QN02_9HYPH|nr:hypothetical protein [Zhengella mangrovi]PHP66905.1 hypothetical protein CSC94_12470 [Zhengella mangrovi]
MKPFKTLAASAIFVAIAVPAAFAMDHLAVTGADQDMSGGSVTASMVTAPADGWLVVHRTDDAMKPGPVIGHARLMKGENMNVTAQLSEAVKPGEKVMLMLHGEDGGMKAGEFEYSLGAKEDGPVRVDGKLVMAVVTAK